MHDIEQLVAQRPDLHAWPDGRPANWSVAPDVLRFIYQNLEAGMNTLETGSGQTTIAFAMAGTNHTCISPNRDEAERIRAYCVEHGIDLKVNFMHESSDVVLSAGTDIPDSLDFVLIDGAHRFPFPILDWHFTEGRLRVGGIVCVDDYPMPSVRILHDFLMGEDEWKLIRIFQRSSFFRRARETVNVWDWADQKINKSALQPAPSGKRARLLKRAKGFWRKTMANR